jgi:uncharacterized membrane protein
MVSLDTRETTEATFGLETRPLLSRDLLDSPPPTSLGGTFRRSGFYLSCIFLLATNALLLSGYRIAFVGAALGWWLIIIHPTFLIWTTRFRRKVSGVERAVFSVGAVLFALIVGGLLLDVVLPHLGVPRPLAQRPILVAVDVMNIALMSWRIRRGAITNTWRASLGSIGHREWRVLSASACCVPLVVAGANRLNNGHGDLVALVGLSCVAATFAFLLGWREQIRDSVVAISAYFLGLSLLLATSLRGWYITGHDIQQEFLVFQLTKNHGVWNIASLRDAYNACLSITILPTEIWQMVRVDDPYIYKVFFQLLFAVCPVMVYLLARRFWSKQISILSLVYFVGFPTFFTDMPFLNRQEIAFLFLGLAFLAMTRRHWSVWRRRLALVICAVGIGLSHYSTMYVFIGTLAIAWFAENGFHGLGRLRRRLPGLRGARQDTTAVGWADTTKSVTFGVIIAAGLVVIIWGGLITHTTAGITSTVKAVYTPTSATHSVDGNYGLLSGKGPSNHELLTEYLAETLHDRKVDDPGTYLPLAKARVASTPAVEATKLPVTGVGRLLANVHIPVATVNDVVRDLASKGEQVFIGIGFLTIACVAWRRRLVGRNYYFLGLGSVVMVGAVTVLPGLSVSYGLLRAFQQSLILVAPILVLGSFALFKPLGRVWSARAATVLALGFLVSTIGVMPQILGGYPAQLSLNNSGVYYNDYYLHPQEAEAVNWLGTQPETLPAGVQAENYTDMYYFKGQHATGAEYVTDIFPTLVRKSTWVLLGYSTVRTGIATAPVDGDLVPYRYPTGLLNQNKNLVYNDGGTVIYK